MPTQKRKRSRRGARITVSITLVLTATRLATLALVLSGLGTLWYLR
ncbi:hypothetical protein [Amycolatopsis anabasis]|nr:hypothetical protein [Amycolatopsis anabasis]